MIKLGKLTQNACNKNFPNNWIAIAKMVRLNYELSNNETSVTIYLDDTNELIIDKYNHITCTAPLTNAVITSLIMESVKAVKNKNEMGDISNV